jgi:hypothetical protein
VIECDEVVNHLIHEGVALGREDEVVAYAHRPRFGENDLEAKKRVHSPSATNVEIHVDSTVFVEDKVSDGICSLNCVGIRIEDGQEPGVILGDEGTRRSIRPKHVLAGRGATDSTRSHQREVIIACLSASRRTDTH